MTAEIVETVQSARFPKEWGGLWKRERERKPLGGERISIVRCALSPPKEVVARTPVNGSCVTHPVKQIESHTTPQASGKPILRKNSTQIIKKRTKGTGHRSKLLLRKNSTQTIKNTPGINAHKKVSPKIKNGTISIVPFTYDISPLPESETPGTTAPTASPVPADGGRSSPTWTAADPPAA